jgi:hypothetical protein
MLVYGYRPRDPLGNKVALALADELEGDRADVEALREGSLEKIEREQRKQKERFDQRRRKPTRYQQGDLVLVEREATASGQTRKLEPIYKGPYMVEEVMGNDRYLLKDIPGAPRTQRPFHSVFASDRMKHWCLPCEYDEFKDHPHEDEQDEFKDYPYEDERDEFKDGFQGWESAMIPGNSERALPEEDLFEEGFRGWELGKPEGNEDVAKCQDGRLLASMGEKGGKKTLERETGVRQSVS